MAQKMRDGAKALEDAALAIENAATLLEQGQAPGISTGTFVPPTVPLASPGPVVLVATGVAATNELRSAYPNRQLLLDDARRLNFRYAIAIDGTAAWPGFGPANQYKTNADGSVTAD
jgi:hypothetical protein